MPSNGNAVVNLPTEVSAQFLRIWDMQDCTAADNTVISGTQWLDKITGAAATGPIARPASADFGGKRGARIQDLSKRMNFPQVDGVTHVVVVIRDDGTNGDGTGANTTAGGNLFGLANSFNEDERAYPNGRHWVGNKSNMMGRKNGFKASLCTFSRDTELSIYSYPLPGGAQSIDGVGSWFDAFGNGPTNATVCFVGLRSSAMSDADEIALVSSLQPVFNTPTTHKPLVICSLDSRTIGQELSGVDAIFLGNGWPAQLSGMEDFKGYDFAVLAVSGYTPDNRLSGSLSVANNEAYFLPLEDARPLVIFVNWGITNAIVNTANTGAGEYAKHEQIAAQQRAAVPTGRAKKVLICTEIDRGSSTLTGTANHAQFTTQRNAFNTLARENPNGAADGVVDLDADSRLADVNDTDVYGDTLHQTPLGYGIIAEDVGAGITELTEVINPETSIWDAQLSEHSGAGTFGKALSDILAKVNSITITDGKVSINLSQSIGAGYDANTLGRLFWSDQAHVMGKWEIDKNVSPNKLKMYAPGTSTVVLSFDLSPGTEPYVTKTPS